MTIITTDNTFIFGDSIAHGVQGAGGFGGVTQDSISPRQILRNIENAIAANPEALRDKNVILSSGLSNSATPAELETVRSQITALKNKGAHVILMGVSDSKDGLRDLNKPLRDLATETQSYFAPLTETDSGRVHPKSYREQLASLRISAGEHSAIPGLDAIKQTFAAWEDKAVTAYDIIRHPEQHANAYLENRVNEAAKAAGLAAGITPFAASGTNPSPADTETPPASANPHPAANPPRTATDNNTGDDKAEESKGFSLGGMLGGFVKLIMFVLSALFSALGLGSFFKGLTGEGTSQNTAPDTSRQPAPKTVDASRQTPPKAEPSFKSRLESFEKSVGDAMHTTVQTFDHLGHEALNSAKGLSNSIGNTWDHVVGSVKLAYEDIRKHFGASNLELGVIKQESGGLVNAHSKTGAQGLMQLMPATGHELAQKKGQVYDITNVRQNFELGRDQLNKLKKHYNGNVELTLAAYNAGQGRVDNAVRQYGDNWMAAMPKETQKYVPAVLAHTRQFEQQEIAQNQTRLEYASVESTSAPLAGVRLGEGTRNASIG